MVAAKKCSNCPRQARPDRSTCAPCGAYFAERQLARRQRIRESGQCLTCPAPREPNLERCSACTQKHNNKQRDRHKRKQRSKTCLRCQFRAEAGQLCLSHWFRRKAREHGGLVTASTLNNLWLKQGGRCFYTGRKLVPGVNASLDHKRPQTKGGTSTQRNLCWCLTEINIAKRNLTPTQFVTLCFAVVKHRQRRSFNPHPPAGHTPGG